VSRENNTGVGFPTLSNMSLPILLLLTVPYFIATFIPAAAIVFTVDTLVDKATRSKVEHVLIAVLVFVFSVFHVNKLSIPIVLLIKNMNWVQALIASCFMLIGLYCGQKFVKLVKGF